MLSFSCLIEGENLQLFTIKIGNIVAEVQANHSYLKNICEPYFTTENANCHICIDKSSVENELKSVYEIRNATELRPEDTAEWFLEVYALLHKLLPILPEYDMLFIHGSAIRYRGKAYIFVAPSGTGKSTHTRFWRECYGDEVTVINDDKPFLAFRNDMVFLCGTPWRGKHNIGQNLEVELGGICILSRGESNCICQIDPSDAVTEIIKQTNLHEYKDNVLPALNLIDKLLKKVPVYRLSCTPTLEAAEVCRKEIIK